MLYKGKYYMDENIVLVTITYRVGALGKIFEKIKKLAFRHLIVKFYLTEFFSSRFFKHRR